MNSSSTVVGFCSYYQGNISVLSVQKIYVLSESQKPGSFTLCPLSFLRGPVVEMRQRSSAPTGGGGTLREVRPMSYSPFKTSRVTNSQSHRLQKTRGNETECFINIKIQKLEINSRASFNFYLSFSIHKLMRCNLHTGHTKSSITLNTDT